MTVFDNINPESFRYNFEEETFHDRCEDTLDEIKICPVCQGEVRDGKCLYCEFEIN